MTRIKNEKVVPTSQYFASHTPTVGLVQKFCQDEVPASTTRIAVASTRSIVFF